MLLDDDDASAILQHLDPAEVKSLGKSMYAASEATEADVETALERFVRNNRALSSLAVGAPARIQDMMHQALGSTRADTILSEIAPKKSLPNLEALLWMENSAISELVANEHPQVAAIMGPVSRDDVEAAQKGIVATAKAMAASGEIMLGGQSNDYV